MTRVRFFPKDGFAPSHLLRGENVFLASFTVGLCRHDDSDVSWEIIGPARASVPLPETNTPTPAECCSVQGNVCCGPQVS